MFFILPGEWKIPEGEEGFNLTSRPEEDHRRVRDALRAGHRLFLIGAEGAATENCFLAVTDHISLFGGSPLAGSNEDDLGPRFPSLMDLYIAPEGSWRRGIAARVPDWRLGTPAELDLLQARALVSRGIQEAEIAGHAGARVILLVRCHAWGGANRKEPELIEAAAAAEREYTITVTEGGEEREL